MARPLWITSLLTLWTASLGLAQAPHGPAKDNHVVFEAQGSTTWVARNGPETLPPPTAYPSNGAATWSASSNTGATEMPAAGVAPLPTASPAGPDNGGCASC